MEKQILTNLLDEKYDALIQFLIQHSDEKFEYREAPGKWSAGQHVDHLIKSANMLSKAMKLPKFFMSYKFGKCNREERTYDGLKTKYKNKLKEIQGVKFERSWPAEVTVKEKNKKIAELDKSRKDLQKALRKWSEKNMGIYILPHPAIGRLTIREMIYFTAFHTEHHHQILAERY